MDDLGSYLVMIPGWKETRGQGTWGEMCRRMKGASEITREWR